MNEDIVGNMLESWAQSFFAGVGDKIKDYYLDKAAMEKSKEGIKEEYVKNRLDLVVKELHKDVAQTPLFTEAELKKKFDLYYQKLGFSSDKYKDDTRKKELFECFEIYVSEYISSIQKGLSLTERQLLDRTAGIKADTADIKADTADIKDGVKKLRDQFQEEQGKTFISIEEGQLINIGKIDESYTSLNNFFDFEEDHVSYNSPDSGTGDLKEVDVPFMVPFLIENIGNTIIKDICISNPQLLYYQEDNDSYAPVVKYDKSIQNEISMRPGCKNKLYMTLRVNATKPEDEKLSAKNFPYDNIMLWFKLTIKTEEIESKSIDKDVQLCLKKSQEYNGIFGEWIVYDEFKGSVIIQGRH